MLYANISIKLLVVGGYLRRLLPVLGDRTVSLPVSRQCQAVYTTGDDRHVYVEQQILVPVDDSNRSKNGLRYALEHFPDAEFTAVHVVSSGTGDLGALAGTSGEVPDQELGEQEATAILEAAEEVASEHGVELGSVAENVVRRSPVPVLVVR